VLSNFLHNALPAPMLRVSGIGLEGIFQFASGSVALLGILLAYWFYLERPGWSAAVARSTVGSPLRRFWRSGWAFDWLYDGFFTFPYVSVSRLNRRDVVDLVYRLIAWICRVLNAAFSALQTGNLRWYAAGIGGGSLFILALVVLL